MKTRPAEKARQFLFNRVMAVPFLGWTMEEWMRMLRRHRFAVDPSYWPRASLVTEGSVLNSLFARREARRYDAEFQNVAVREPLFILGHWRSGTTFLHNLLSFDQQWAYPGPWQALNPRTFLTTSKYAKNLKFLKTENRMIDNVAVGNKLPFEDELAFCPTMRSPYLRWAFPRSRETHDQYLTFRGVPEHEIAEWKASVMYFFRKLTWKFDRPLLLKSPPHTCRIKLLLELFPDARFVHIHRNPYQVFRSTKRADAVMAQVSCFQNAPPEDTDAVILKRYNELYDVFFEERSLIPEGRFGEVCYEDLEQNPVAVVRSIYEQLSLPGFDTMLPALQRYVDAQGEYRKNNYTDLAAGLRKTIAGSWQRNFELWGYPA